ncbi:DNA-binding transcriptional regulator, AcrR family [Halopenitus malekzadehii]|uniref:DNA-binding transcriptional regulator, AcrR family n=1 Tax=Halopenitus malekzadehii TaxID=1267564 RepID=A0A1H6JHJ1_9EURY|nr:TetR/AcrR family transcriptional regulator [Halopenitus malekzadehii]SEH59889.1 DNA-binding transcriptional regulator, AcrR family [Halopenitus malekzadehii]
MAESPDRRSSDIDEAIMQATYRALHEHGYAGLTMQRIADEYGKSTAAIHYHYDTKEDLLAAFLDYLLERFREAVHEVETTDPEQRLQLLLDQLIVDPGDHHGLLIAMLEMRSQAPYNETFRERFRQNDEYIRYLLETVIDHGNEAGVFAGVDPEHTARTLLTVVDGARTRAVVLEERTALETARRAVEEYVDAVVLA